MHSKYSNKLTIQTHQTKANYMHNAKKAMHAMAEKKGHFCKVNAIRIISAQHPNPGLQ